MTDRAPAAVAIAAEAGGSVRCGDRRGRTLGFPTANLAPPPDLLLPDGVYAVRVGIDDEPPVRAGLATLGGSPTFAVPERRLEVHLLGFSGDLYGRRLRVTFHAYLGAQRRFRSPRALVGHIRRLAGAAARILEAAPAR